jgi:hypothetical protein
MRVFAVLGTRPAFDDCARRVVQSAPRQFVAAPIHREKQGGSMTHLVRKLLVLSATVAATLVSVAASALAQDGGSISGRAIDATTSAPISSAQVQIIGTGRGGTTADDGRFRIANVRPGTYQVRVLRIGYQASTQAVTLGPGQAITLEYSLAPAVVTLDEVVTLSAPSHRSPPLSQLPATLRSCSQVAFRALMWRALEELSDRVRARESEVPARCRSRMILFLS